MNCKIGDEIAKYRSQKISRYKLIASTAYALFVMNTRAVLQDKVR